MRRVIIGLCALALAACGAPPAATLDAAGPEGVVASVYAGETPPLDQEPTNGRWDEAMPLTDSFRALIAADDAATEPGFVGAVDFDPVIAGQDGEVRELELALIEPPADGRSVVQASFMNGSTPMIVNWTLKEEGGAWRIDNIASPTWDLRALYTNAAAAAPTDKLMGCLAYLTLAGQAIEAKTIDADGAALRTAGAAYEKAARAALPADEFEARRAEDLIGYDGGSAAQLKASAEICVAQAPKS
jgi:hypothetical protein